MDDKFVESLEKGEGTSKEVKEAIDKLSESMVESSKETSEMTQSFTEFNSVLEVFSKIKDVALKAFNVIGDAWNEIDEGLDIIVTKTGASGDALDNMNEQFKNVYSNMAVDSKSVGEAIGEVNTQFGLQEEELEDATTLLLKYSEINGSDVTSSIQLAKKAMDQFGLSNKDIQRVLDSVTKAGQDTGVSVDLLFDKVTTGAPILTNLGLSFEESIVLLSEFEKSGFESSKMLSYMTKAQAVAAKDGKGLSDVLGDFSQKAKTSTDQTKLLEEANTLFGTKGGAVMLKAIQEGKLGFDDLSNSAQNTSGAVNNTYENIIDPVDQFTIAQNNLKLVMADVGTTIQETLAPAFTFIVEIIQNVVSWFTSLDGTTKTVILSVLGILAAVTAVITIIGVVQAALVTLGPMLTSIKAAFVAFGGGLSSLFTFVTVNPIVLIITAIIAAIILIIKNWDSVKTKTIEIWNAIVGFLKPVIEGIKSFIKNVFSSIKQTIFNIWEGIKTITSSVWNKIKEVISTVINAIKVLISNVFNGIKSIVSTIWNSIKSVITNIWSGIKQGVTNSVNSVKNVVSNVFNGIKNTVTDIWNGIKNAITRPIESAKNTISNIISKIKGLFNFKFKWPKIPLPHFSLSGSVNPFSSNFPPRISIDWYKQGGIFDSPSIIGVGEAGSEAVVPTHKLDRFFEEALNRVNPKTESKRSGIVINIEKLEVRKEEDIEIIAQKLFNLIDRKERGLGNV